MIRPHSGPYPHVAGCAGCRVRQLCDVCGAPVFPRVVTRLLSRCLAHAGALVLCLLLSVSSASAECAWVLWSNFISRDPTAPHAASSGGLWIPESAGTRAECERSRDRLVEASVKHQAMGPGTLIFVERLAEHRFVDVTEDLTVLVFFVPPEGSSAGGAG